MDLIFWLLWGFVVVSAIWEIPYTVERIKALAAGVKALVFLPVAWITLAVTAGIAIYAAEQFPILNWGWLGTNIIAAPLSQTIQEKAANPSLQIGTVETLWLIAVFAIIIYACLMFNYYEEKGFRQSLKAVVIWALLHLTMGIPIYAVFPIFSLGILYKYIHDHYSLNHSYCLHFFTNMSLFAVVGAAIFFGVGA